MIFYRKRGAPRERINTDVSPETKQWLRNIAHEHGHNNLGRALDVLRETSSTTNEERKEPV